MIYERNGKDIIVFQDGSEMELRSFVKTYGLDEKSSENDNFKNQKIYSLTLEELGLETVPKEKIKLTLVDDENLKFIEENGLYVESDFCYLATDMAIVTGCNSLQGTKLYNGNKKIKEYNLNQYYLGETLDKKQKRIVTYDEFNQMSDTSFQTEKIHVIRPVLKTTKEFIKKLSQNKTYSYGLLKYGMYPQKVVSGLTEFYLNSYYNGHVFGRKFAKTSNSYTIVERNGVNAKLVKCPVYEFDGKKYIRIKANNRYGDSEAFKLSNEKWYKNNQYIWIEILPIKWGVNEKSNSLISLNGLLSGIELSNYNIKFNETELFEFMNDYMLKDMLQYEYIDYEMLEEDEQVIEIPNKKTELPEPSNILKLISEIEYNLSKLKDIDIELYLKFKKEFEEYLKTNNTSIGVLGNLNGRIQAEVLSRKVRPIDLINYLANLKLEYINNFINENREKTVIDLKKLDKINELFLYKQDDYALADKVKVLNDLAFIYFLEVYENRNDISINILEQSYFKQHLARIVTIIKALEELNIIKCSYFVSLVDNINIKVVLDMIKNTEFIKVKEETIVKVLKTL